MGKHATARSASTRGEVITNRGGKSATLIPKEQNRQTIEGSINKNSTVVKEAKAGLKKEKSGGKKSTRSGPTPSSSKITEVDNNEDGLTMEFERALEIIDQPKTFILGGGPSKRCFGVTMTRAVMKKLIGAKEKGITMKLKISESIEINLGGKDNILFTKNKPDKISTILALNGDEMEIVGDVTQQVISTKETNHDAKMECLKRNLQQRMKEEKKHKEKKKVVMLTELRPDPEVVKPKNKTNIRKSIKKKEPDSIAKSKIVTYIGPGKPPPRFSIGNDDPGVPLKKRVIHLIAVEELTSEQIANKVQDNVPNVQKILSETATLKGEIWKLKTETWLMLEPYTFPSYDTSKINKVVSMMNAAADKLGYPSDAPERPRPPKPIASSKHSNSTIESSESSKRRKTGSNAYSEVSPISSASKSAAQPSSTSSKGGKTVRNGVKAKGKGSKVNISNSASEPVSTETIDDFPDSPTKVNTTTTATTRGGHTSRGAKSARARGTKTTSTVSDQPSTAGRTSQTTTSTRGKRGRPVGSKNSTSRVAKATTQKTTTSSAESTVISRNGLPSIGTSNNNISKRSPYHVETLSEFRELLGRFNEKLKVYYEIDARLDKYVTVANEIQADIRNLRSPVINERILEKVRNVFDEGTDVYSEVEMFYNIEEELRMMIEEGNRAAKEAAYCAEGQYMAIFLSKILKISKPLVGILTSIDPFVEIASSGSWSVIADRSKAYRKIMVSCVILGTVAFGTIPVVGKFIGFPGLIASFFVYAIFKGGVTPLVDNMTLNILHRNGEPRAYGRQRLMGTISCGISTAILGFIIDKTSFYILFVDVGLFMSLFLIVILCINPGDFRMGHTAPVPLQPEGGNVERTAVEQIRVEEESPDVLATDLPFMKAFRRLFSPSFIFFLFIIFLMTTIKQAASSFLFVYLSEYFHASTRLMGLSTFTGITLEVIFLFFAQPIMLFVGPKAMIVLGGLCSTLRVALYGFIGTKMSPWLSLPIETLQGIEFALIKTSSLVIVSQLSQPQLRATAIGLLTSTRNLGIGLGSIVGGVLYGIFGAIKMFQYLTWMGILTVALYIGGSLLKYRFFVR
ncbi:4446_t:CDS:10 [Acaulospora morrowiae]|uniref:4446_t:CDS:1 n=1 Tax=Acaulospora morrowiae TaxID=94023 RepID=A0A9N8VBP5_9GLOM|nr:4446_t:CDS:10 [Acaulospora morrowiae]